MTGARPVFVDVNPQTGLLDVGKLEAAITSRSKAVIPVHLYGQCVPMPALMEITKHRGLVIIEDCAQAFGALQEGRKAGSFGDSSAFSFYPTKNLGAAGDGGAVATNDDDVHAKLLKLRNYGQADRYHHECFGINSRLDELQAAILRTKLPFVDSWNALRNSLASYYKDNLNPDIARPLDTCRGNVPNYHLFVVRTTNRERFRSYLAEKGVGTLVHYPIPCSTQKALPPSHRRSQADWVSDRFTDEVVSLPLNPQLRKDEIHYIVSTVNGYRNE
jgi:dTDP-4-amino-4,6-dideoxygalactose transaminase